MLRASNPMFEINFVYFTRLISNIGLISNDSSLGFGQRLSANDQRQNLVELTGIEPVASWLKPGALPAELQPQNPSFVLGRSSWPEANDQRRTTNDRF